MELLYSDFAFWLTLQYDDEHLPMFHIPYTDDFQQCVSKSDCQKYFKLIRRYIEFHNLPVSFKYFLVSEYGPKTHRPHYHCLLMFKLKGSDLNFDQKLKLRFDLYDLVKSSWHQGYVYEKLLHSGVIGYLSKYVFKPDDDFVPEVPLFRLISKGIGLDYLNKLDFQKCKDNLFMTSDGYLPRYYRDKIQKPLPAGLKFTSAYWHRQEVSQKLQGIIENKQQKEVARFNSIDDFFKYQEYLRKSQRHFAEKKQKQKYG